MIDVTDARLKKTERLDVFKLVEKAGFDSADFRWTEKRDHESFRSSMGGGDDVAVSVLVHDPTDFYFRFGAFGNEFSPAVGKRVDYKRHESNWPSRITTCPVWLAELRKEVDCTDVWAIAKQGRVLPDAAIGDNTNLPFDLNQIAEIAMKLDELKKFVLSGQQFQAREAAIVDAQFKYLRESSERLGRKDWLNIAFSVLLSVAIGVALPPEKAKSLLEIAGSLFGSLVHGAAALLK